jgi:N-acetylneuraminic acid mutarotase
MKKAFTTLFLIVICVNSFSQNGWTQLANYSGSGRVAMSGIGYRSNGFAGFGYTGSSSNNFQDWWQYVAASNTWVSKTSLSGPSRYNQTIFCTDSNIYVGLGSNASLYYNDLWKYNSASNSWLQKANFPGTTRYGVIAQAAGNKAYVGLGEHDGGAGIYDYFSDFYEYNETSNTWSSKATFPGQVRYGAFSFLINNVIYVVGGRSEDNYSAWVYLKDMWAYDIATNTWTQKTSYPGNGSQAMGGFTLGQYGYVGLGYTTLNGECKDFWRYDPNADNWTQLPDFPSTARHAMMCFNIGNTGYMGCGFSAGTNLQDFWKYIDPSAGINDNNAVEKISFTITPNPANEKLNIEIPDLLYKEIISIYNLQGQLITQEPIKQTKTELNISNLAEGLYIIKLSGADGVAVKKFIKE